MKNTVFLLVLSMSLLNQSASAQNDFLREPDTKKPLLFANKPAIAEVSQSELQKIFTVSEGALVSIFSGSSVLFSGKIMSLALHNDSKLQTAIIRLTNTEKANLVVSAITGDDGKIVYTAKVLSFQHGDCFVLVRTGNNNYQFVKKSFYEVVGE